MRTPPIQASGRGVTRPPRQGRPGPDPGGAQRPVILKMALGVVVAAGLNHGLSWMWLAVT